MSPPAGLRFEGSCLVGGGFNTGVGNGIPKLTEIKDARGTGSVSHVASVGGTEGLGSLCLIS